MYIVYVYCILLFRFDMRSKKIDTITIFDTLVLKLNCLNLIQVKVLF